MNQGMFMCMGLCWASFQLGQQQWRAREGWRWQTVHHQTGHGGEGELPSSGKRCSQSALRQAWRDWEDLGYGEGCGETHRLSLTPWGAEGGGGALESGAQAQCLMYMSGRRVDIGVQAQWFLPGELWLPAGRQRGVFLCLTPWLQLGIN